MYNASHTSENNSLEKLIAFPSLCFAILKISSTMVMASVRAVMQFANGSSSLISIRENIGSVPDVEFLLEPLLLKAGLIA